MATTDQELRTLNKTVGDAVNILKLYVGSTGQLKAKNEKEQKIIDGLLNVVDEAQEAEKRKRAFAERERDKYGRFIKKREGAWGKFLDMAEGTFKFLDKITLGITGKIKGMVSSVLSHVSGFFAELKSHFLSLFGEESEWFGMLAAIKDSISGFASTIMGWIWKKTPNWAKKMIKSLEGMYKLQVKQMKLSFLDAGGDTKKKGISIMGMVGALVFAVGAAIGAFMHRYFVVLTKLPGFSKLTRLFTKIKDMPFVGKLMSTLEKIPFMGKFLGGIGKLFKAFKFGFKFLGWPLTIVLSVIDFIKGFKNTEGTLWEKIKGGLWGALEGFIELPVKFIGWVIESVLGLFGVEVTGVGDKMMNIIRGGFDFLLDVLKILFDNNPLVGFFKGFFGEEGDFTTKLKAGLMGFLNLPITLMGGLIELVAGWFGVEITGVGDKIKEKFSKSFDIFLNGINKITDFIGNLVNNLLGYVTSKIPGGPGSVGGWIKTMLGGSDEVPNKSNVSRYKISDARNIDAQKNKSQKERDDGFFNTLKELLHSAKESALETKRVVNNMANNVQSGGSTGDVRQIPDELDNALVCINNHNGAID